MPQNITLTQELNLATMIFEISVLELVIIAMLPKIRQKIYTGGCHNLVSCASEYYRYCERSRSIPQMFSSASEYQPLRDEVQLSWYKCL